MEIYTNGQTEFLFVRERAVIEAGCPVHRLYAEFEHDTCITQSDYRKLIPDILWIGQSLFIAMMLLLMII